MNFTFLVLVGSIFAIVGFLAFKFPPKKINHFYGYRTPTSMQSQERWDFAQRFSSKKMIQLGIILVLIEVLISVFSLKFFTDSFRIAIILIGVFIMIMSTEMAIRKHFPKNSN